MKRLELPQISSILTRSNLQAFLTQTSMDPQQIARDVVTDSVFAFRGFRRSPGWTALMLLTIALGVGASTAVFSVADAFLIRPLAYRDATHVYAVSLQGKAQTRTIPFPAAVVREWRNSAGTIEAAAAVAVSPPHSFGASWTTSALRLQSSTRASSRSLGRDP